MTAALLDGCRRVADAPAVVAGAWLTTLLAAAPFAAALHGEIADHLGASVAGERMAAGVDRVWWDEFSADAGGLGKTFTPTVIGFAAPLSNLSAFLDGEGPPLALVTAVVGYLAVWTFLAGGMLDRLARARRVAGPAFFAACGAHFFRFCRLAAIAGLIYWALFDLLHDWLFDDLYAAAVRDVTVERTGFLWRLGAYALFGAVLLPVSLVFDYARIRTVVEDRRSAIGALLAAWRFVRRRPGATAGLYALNAGLFLLVLLGYAAVAPSAGAPTWAALLAGQAYVAARAGAKLIFYASQTAYFQSQLAHAGYVAAPLPARPESPAAEAITGSGGGGASVGRVGA